MSNKLIPKEVSALEVSAQEVYEFVREKLAPIRDEERAKVVAIMDEAHEITEITSNKEMAYAIDVEQRMKGAVKAGAARIEDMKKKANSVHKGFTSTENDIGSNVDTESRRIKDLVVAFKREEDRKRAEEERKAREAARKAEEDRRIAEAEAAEDAGRPEEAEAILEEPIVETPVVIPETPKVDGAAFRAKWKFRIRDVNEIPRRYMIPDEKAIQSVVNGLKGATDIPGIEVYEDMDVATKAK